MDYAMHDVGGAGERGGVNGLDAAALIYGDVDYHRPCRHAGNHLLRDEVRGACPGDQHRPDDQFGTAYGLGDVPAVGGDSAEVAAQDLLEVAQALQVDVDNGDTRARAERPQGGAGAHCSATDDDDAPLAHARYAAQQHAAPALRLLEIVRADLNGHAAGHLAHRNEQRQRFVLGLYRLIGDAGDPAREQFAGKRLSRCQVEVSKEQQPGPEEVVF